MAKDIMMSIKPEYVERILNGTKQWEFRKRVTHNIDGCKIYIYETAPIKKVVGSFVCDRAICGNAGRLFSLSYPFGGITHQGLIDYLGDNALGYALHIKSVQRLSNPLELSDFGIKRAPQSWCYIPAEDGGGAKPKPKEEN